MTKLLTIVSSILIAFFFSACASSNGAEPDIFATEVDEPRFRILKNGQFGYINSSGKVVIQPRFDEAWEFEGSHALVKIQGRSRIIDTAGRLIEVPKDFDIINSFSDGMARGNLLTTSPYTKAYLNESGKVVGIDLKIWGACPFSEGLACVQIGKWGYIDKSGRLAIEPRFDEAYPFSEGLASVKIWDHSKAARHKSGFIDKTGKIVIAPTYDVAQSFSEGLAAVGQKIGDEYRFGFIDKVGRIIVEAQFDWAYGFNEEKAAVRIGDKWGFINRNGVIIIKPQFSEAEGFSEGLAAVRVDGKWGFINDLGKMVVLPSYSEAFSFRHGLAMVSVNANNYDDVIGHFDKDGEWGYIDRTGKYIWNPTR